MTARQLSPRIVPNGSETGDLFVESIDDALRDAVRAAGGAKAVGATLFPSKGVEAAGRYLLDCLNPSRAEHLTPEQMLHVLRIARDAGYHGAKHWLDAAAGYAPTPPVDRDDQRAELARTIAAAGETLRRAVAALDRIERGAR